MTKLPLLPRLDPDQNSGSPLATSRWQSSQSVMRALLWTENDPEADSPILLGQLHDENGKRHFMGFDDDRHITLIAGSRAGKGVGMILPNLLTYKGSVVCIDPKGENASVTPFTPSQRLAVASPFRGAFLPPLKTPRPMENSLSLWTPTDNFIETNLPQIGYRQGRLSRPLWNPTTKGHVMTSLEP